MVILGDFNFPKISWHTLSGDSAAAALFCEFVFDNDLDQLVTEPTHCQGSTLDLILTNCSRIVHDVKAHKKSCIPTDHFIISFSIQTPVLPSSRSKSRFVYNFSKANFNLMADYLLYCNFEPCLSSLDVEFVWSYIKCTIYKAMDLFIPKLRLRANNSPKWFNATIRHKLNCIHHLRKKAKHHSSVRNQQKLDQSELELQDVMKIAKSEYESNLIQEFAFSKNYKISKYIKSLRKEDSLPPTMHDGTTTATEDLEKVTLFNKYFFSVFTSSSYCLPAMEDNTTIDAAITNIDISDSEVYEALAALDPSKSSGIDGIGTNILKLGAQALYVPLHHLFNLSLTHCSIPSEWKIHQITPILKAGERANIKNIGQFHYYVALLRSWNVSYLTKLSVLCQNRSQLPSLDSCIIYLLPNSS